MTSLWERKSDGVEFTTRTRPDDEDTRASVLMRRVDGRRCHWATWEGIARKYTHVKEI